MEPPFGRGLKLEIEIGDAACLQVRPKASGLSFYNPLKTEWFRYGNIERGQMQLLVQDPEGDLLCFVQYSGIRAAHSG